MVNINGEIWRVLLVPPDHHELQKIDGGYSLGVCDDAVKIIYINSLLDDFMFKKVLCHELTHAAMFSYNVELSIDQEEILAELVATYGQEIIDITNLLFNRPIKNRKKGT